MRLAVLFCLICTAANVVSTVLLAGSRVTPASSLIRLDDLAPGSLVAQILQSVTPDLGESDVGRLRLELEALGTEALPSLLDVLEHGQLDGGSALSDRQRDLLLQTLAGFQRSLLRTTLRERVAANSSEGLCIGALQLLAVMGQGSDLDLAVEFSEQQRDPLPSVVAVALTEATEAILDRSPRSLSEVKQVIVYARTDVGYALVQGVGENGASAAIDMLTASLGVSQGLDLALIVRAGRCAELSSQATGPDAAEAVRGYLVSENRQVLRETVMTLGRMRDSAALPSLIELLASEDKALRSTAHWALKQITGLKLRNSQACWSAWYAAEVTWFEEQLDGILERLASEDRNHVLVALGELGRHRIAAQELAQAVEGELWAEDSRVRLAACAALAGLRSKGSTLALVGVLEDENEGVALKALEALQAITGKSLGLDPEAWQAVLSD